MEGGGGGKDARFGGRAEEAELEMEDLEQATITDQPGAGRRVSATREDGVEIVEEEEEVQEERHKDGEEEEEEVEVEEEREELFRSGTGSSSMWNTRRRTDFVDVLEKRKELFKRGGQSSSSFAWGEILQKSVSDISSLRQSLRESFDGGSGPSPLRATGEVKFKLRSDHSSDDDDDLYAEHDGHLTDLYSDADTDVEQGTQGGGPDAGLRRSQSQLRTPMSAAAAARLLPSIDERLPLLMRTKRKGSSAMSKAKASDSEDSDASTSSSFSEFSPYASGSSIPASPRMSGAHMRTSLNIAGDDLYGSRVSFSPGAGGLHDTTTLAEMRRRLPPIFTISTEAVEFDFKAGKPYGRYKQRRITRPRSQTLRQSTTSSFGSGMGISPRSPVVKKLPKWSQTVYSQLSDCWLMLANQHRFLWLFLPLLGLLCGLLGGMLDLVVDLGRAAHYYVGENLVADYYAQYGLWTLYLLVFAGASMAFIRINPAAQGSGVPELKSILSGVQLNNFLAPSIFLAKLGSMTAAAAGGLILSKGGPFIHLCALVAHFLCQLPLFTLINQSKTMHKVMLAVGCGMGIAADVNVPIGGVLFSIEVTSTYFPVRNYFYSFYCAVVASIANRFLTGSPYVLSTELPRESWVWAELGFHALLGVIGGVLGAIFVWVFGNVIIGRRWLVAQADDGKGSTWKRVLFYISHPYTYGVFVALYTALLTFPGNFRFLSLGTNDAMKDLSHVGPLNDLGEHATDWLALPFYVSLALFVFSRFSGTVLAATMPISCGVFGPCLVMGMGMGRAVGEYLHDMFPAGLAYFDQDLSYTIIPATYAITGAAAFSAGVTHTLSTAVIVLEMSGQLNLVAPIMVAVSISVAVSRMLSVNYYDKIAILRNLPFLPDLDASVYEVTAGEIMETNVPFVLQHATPKEVASLLSKNKDANVFPVVNSKEVMTLKGYVERRELTNYLLQCFQIVVNALNESQDVDDENAAVTRRAGRGLAASMAPFSAWDDIRQARKGQLGRRGSNIGSKPYGTFDQRRRSTGTKSGRRSTTEQVITLTEAELLSKFKLFEEDDAGLTPEERKSLPAIPHTPLPIQIVDILPLTEIHMLFITFRLTEGYVTSNGSLVGVINRDTLKHAIETFSNGPMTALRKLCKFYAR